MVLAGQRSMEQRRAALRAFKEGDVLLTLTLTLTLTLALTLTVP